MLSVKNWKTDKKVAGVNVDPPKFDFSADYISALDGAALS